MTESERRQVYWRRHLRILFTLLLVWFSVSLGGGVLLVDWLNQMSFFGFPLGFWIAQQGSILAFIGIIVAYVASMNRLDREFGFHEE